MREREQPSATHCLSRGISALTSPSALWLRSTDRWAEHRSRLATGSLSTCAPARGTVTETQLRHGGRLFFLKEDWMSDWKTEKNKGKRREAV
ncbi:hypothetical protein KOW79_013621 [Hemibagrus wyckioides]|uniref:Uncharacterized protein n=1 Tax=Hemibagrus wyckioides TaxID=337641 RepID=A0A9D3NJS3_9TELE|nr:hypothetical protein KOW79_013621 [Hemibagrus wyckioides]